MSNECAIHSVVIDGLQEQISQIDRNQKEVKDLIISAHKESLSYIQNSTDGNRRDIEKLSIKLDGEIFKMYERDRENLKAINELKMKHGLYTGIGITGAAVLTWLINAMNVATVILN